MASEKRVRNPDAVDQDELYRYVDCILDVVEESMPRELATVCTQIMQYLVHMELKVVGDKYGGV